MLIIKDCYKINKKTKEIIKRQKVDISCDECGCVWSSLYGNRKRKIYKKDLCKSCRSKKSYKNQISLSKRRWSGVDAKENVKCLFCGKVFGRFPSQINKTNNFCSIKCRDDSFLKRYNHLYKTFEDNENEVAYLFGLILGDGNFKKTQKHTTRVSISFNSEQISMVMLAENVLKKLGIKYYSKTEKKSKCTNVGFVLLDDLLKKYDMLWSGSKYKSQPYPSTKIVRNINMVVGLINSDGRCIVNKSNIVYIVFSNTVNSIVKAFTDCLKYHKINFRYRKDPGRFDERTGNTNKDSMHICLKKEYTNCIKNEKSIALKGENGYAYKSVCN